MNIILVGMMGSGKTTVGKELHKQIPDFNFVDIDEEIEKSTQKKISEIFLKHGEPFFRMLETEKIKHFCAKDNQIISTGGGAFETNKDILLKSGTVIYLKATPQDIFDRIKNASTRPLLKKDFSIDRISSLLNKREKNYEQAHYTIDTTAKTPYNIVQEIIGVIYG